MNWQMIQDFFSIVPKHWWLVGQVFLVVLVVLFANFVLRRMVDRLHVRLSKNQTIWDDPLIDALRKPLTWMVWLFGLGFAAELLYQQTEVELLKGLQSLRQVGTILIAVWFVIRLLKGGQKAFVKSKQLANEPIDQTTVDAIGKLLRAAVMITGGLVLLQTMGYSISGILAFGGIGGIAVGFAAKDLLANFFGGLMIYLDRPFAIGDWVNSPERDIEGVVEEIGWRRTSIRRFDKRPVYVPNSVFTTLVLVNPSRMTHRRISETIGVRYDDINSLKGILEDTRQMLKNHPAVDATQTLMVNFNEFADSSLDFFIYCMTKTTVWTEYHAVKEELLFKIADIIEAHGAAIAFPTQTIDLPDTVSEKIFQGQA